MTATFIAALTCAPLAIARGRLSIWMVLAGKGTLASRAGTYRRDFDHGDTVLVPASAPALYWSPAANRVELLRVHLPENT